MNRLLICLLLFSSALIAQDTTRSLIDPTKTLEESTRSRAVNFLDHDHALSQNYSIDKNGVTIYRDSTEAIHVPEFFVAWNEVSVFQNMLKLLPKDSVMHIMQRKGMNKFSAQQQSDYEFWKIPERDGPNDPAKLLNGLKIAIDPGHTAADTSQGRIEDKYVSFKFWNTIQPRNTSLVSGYYGDSSSVNLVEGQLTWYVAEHLAIDLRGEGATVLLTRRGPGMTAFGKTFQQWKIDDYPRTLDSLLKIDSTNKNLLKLKTGVKKDDRFIFHYVFRDVELKKRAEVINTFHPDLTVVIHFNVDEKNKDWKKPTDKNFCMAFVPGSFEKGELTEVESRFDFLRLLLTDDLPQSIDASGIATQQFTEQLRVPLAKTPDATYLQDHCIYTGKDGVFCRNLSLTRMVEGPMIYGETLYQDNYIECTDLSYETFIFVADNSQKYYYRPRLDEVEQAYHYAVLQWAKARN